MSCSVLKTYKNASYCIKKNAGKRELSENENPMTGLKMANSFTSTSKPSDNIHPLTFLDLEIERSCSYGIPIDDYNLERSLSHADTTFMTCNRAVNDPPSTTR